MDINEAILETVTPIVAVCVPDLYTGTEQEYCTFDYIEAPVHFGDDCPEYTLYSVQLHWCLPLGCDPRAKKAQLKRAIADGDFTYPSVTNASDEDGLHFVFEFEYVEAVV